MRGTVYIDEDLLDRQLAEATRPATEAIVVEVVSAAWIEAPVKTGRLRDSIYGYVESWPAEHGGIKGVIASDLYYAGFVHNGTVHRGPNPYLDRALEAVVT